MSVLRLTLAYLALSATAPFVRGYRCEYCLCSYYSDFIDNKVFYNKVPAPHNATTDYCLAGVGEGSCKPYYQKDISDCSWTGGSVGPGKCILDCQGNGFDPKDPIPVNSTCHHHKTYSACFGKKSPGASCKYQLDTTASGNACQGCTTCDCYYGPLNNYGTTPEYTVHMDGVTDKSICNKPGVCQVEYNYSTTCTAGPGHAPCRSPLPSTCLVYSGYCAGQGVNDCQGSQPLHATCVLENVVPGLCYQRHDHPFPQIAVDEAAVWGE